MRDERSHSALPSPERVLAVADWSVDPELVATSLQAAAETREARFGLLVPSRLRPLDWIGDPGASCPCAERQVEAISRLAEARGISVEVAQTGDPERVAAIRSLLERWGAERVLLFERERILPRHPLSVARRVERATGRPTERIAVPARAGAGAQLGRRARRCVPAEARTT